MNTHSLTSLKLGFLACVIAVFALASTTADAAPNSSNNSKMRKFKNLYPGSDANGDGVLTSTEMRAFLMKNISSKSTSSNNASMRRFYANAPQSDLNRDGVLKKSEMINYLARL